MLSVSAAAQPGGVPHQFKGTVTTNGGPAPDGLTLSARISGLDVASTTTYDGGYGRIPCELGYVTDCIFYIYDSDGGSAGKTIEFYINNVLAGEYVLNYGASTELNLEINEDLSICGDNFCGSDESCSSCPADCGTCTSTNTGDDSSSSSSSSSSGGGYVPPTPCDEDWTCSEWSICSVDGKRFRSCTDANSCGTNENEPAEEETCTYTPQEKPSICAAGTRVCVNGEVKECPDGTYWNLVESCEYGCDADAVACKNADGGVDVQSSSGGLTGMFLGNTTAMYGLVVILLVVLGSVVYVKKFR